MIKFEFDATNYINKLNKLDNELNSLVKDIILKTSIELTNNIKFDKISGNILKVQTGRLRNSIKYRVQNSGDNIEGVVSANTKYAKIHEYGFTGKIDVKQHQRIIKTAFGRSITPKTVDVKAFSRNVNYTERSFMRTSLQEIKPKFILELENLIGKKFNE